MDLLVGPEKGTGAVMLEALSPFPDMGARSRVLAEVVLNVERGRRPDR